LRELIFLKFGRQSEWWNDRKIVSEDIQSYALKIQQAEKKYPWLKERGDHLLFYVGLFELYKIIEHSWNSFKDVFDNLQLLGAWIEAFQLVIW
jgi:hypothetical protein